jgi:hypothetical protein
LTSAAYATRHVQFRKFFVEAERKIFSRMGVVSTSNRMIPGQDLY